MTRLVHSAVAAAVAVLALALPARADNTLHVGTPALDPPTITALGIYVPITGDDNFNATIAVRYRVTGTTTYSDALPLQHAHVELVTGLSPAPTPQFAGMIFDLQPDTSYDLELHATDADGAVDQTLTLTGHTRPVPISNPATPRAVAVSDAASLTTALAAAEPGDVITLADGTYSGSFTLMPSGTAANPIVIRGADQAGVILDGAGCTDCNVLEVYGSFVHVENLTLQHANRAIRFETQGATDDVLRRVHIRDVVLAVGSNPDQANFYIADNIMEGRLVWPCVYASTDPTCNAGGVPGVHANDDGIHVEGTGHVIANNTLSGFGDAMKTEQDGAVSIDFYGNDVLWTYDNAVELDGSARNTRAMRNRFTNTYDPLSFQPIFGGPSYAIRNVLVNVADEEFKLHSNGSVPTVGAVLYHNTVVRSTRAEQLSTNIAPLDFTIENNLLIGPTVLDPDGHSVRWDVPGPLAATIDFNGFYPDGQFEYGYGGSGVTYPDFAAVTAAMTFDQHSVLVDSAALAGGLVGPTGFATELAPVTPILSASSTAADRGTLLPNVNNAFLGSAPDLGALESGCVPPIYGPRPAGMDESTVLPQCGVALPDPLDGPPLNGGDDPGHSASSKSGCGCQSTTPGQASAGLVLLLLITRRRRRRLIV